MYSQCGETDVDQLWVLQLTVEVYQCMSDLQVLGDESGSEELVLVGNLAIQFSLLPPESSSGS